jgi:hypothetical protein
MRAAGRLLPPRKTLPEPAKGGGQGGGDQERTALPVVMLAVPAIKQRLDALP